MSESLILERVLKVSFPVEEGRGSFTRTVYWVPIYLFSHFYLYLFGSYTKYVYLCLNNKLLYYEKGN
jgi:hypothetical protein